MHVRAHGTHTMKKNASAAHAVSARVRMDVQ